MAGIVFGVVTFDPVTGQPQAVKADLEWDLGTAVIVADATGGSVVAAERMPWTLVDPALVEQARTANHEMQVDAELQQLLADGGDPEPRTSEGSER